MSEQIIGHVGWSPDFKDRPEPKKLQLAIATGRVRFEPHTEFGKLVSIDLVRCEPEVTDPGVLLSVEEGREVEFIYTNWKGKTRKRRAIMRKLYLGLTEFHKELQWLIEGFDTEKNAVRTYALRDITDVRAV